MINENNLIKVPTLPRFRNVPLMHDLREMIRYCADTYKDETAFIIKTKRATKTEKAEYFYRSFIDYRNDIEDLGLGLMKYGTKGKRLAIIAKNRYEWMVSYFAQVSGLGVVVPLDKDLPSEELRQSMIKAKVEVLVFDKDHKQVVCDALSCPELSSVTAVCMDGCDDLPFDAVAYSDIVKLGKSATVEEKETFRNLPIDGTEMAIILFTSGTSGLAKAVMLSQFNITSNCKYTLDAEDIRRGDVNMAFLPYHHTFGCTGQIMLTFAGAATVYCDGLKYIQQNLVEYKVSDFICVPLIIESIYKKIMATVKKQGKMKKLETGMKISKLLLKLGIDKRRQLFKDIHDQLGGAVRYVISGASPLDPVVAEFYKAIGMEVFQGYGMTETSPVIASEGYKCTCPGTIGRGIPATEVAILNPNEEGIGELIARGPGVMLGYYEAPELTKEAIEDGWIHTGDLVCLTENQMIKICGRSKNVIVLKNGKNVYPEELETLISNIPYVKECMVYGEEKNGTDDVIVAVKVVYMEDAFEGKSVEEINATVKSDIEKINDTVPAYKRINSITVTDTEMEKTTTGKVKRYKQFH
ncbi:MAG: AMP-binding protein [Clostridia bacterium]|nr:AMP-binding protein [Clostridia bacterium]